MTDPPKIIFIAGNLGLQAKNKNKKIKIILLESRNLINDLVLHNHTMIWFCTVFGEYTFGALTHNIYLSLCHSTLLHIHNIHPNTLF